MDDSAEKNKNFWGGNGRHYMRPFLWGRFYIRFIFKNTATRGSEL